MKYKIFFAKQALKDVKLLSPKFNQKLKKVLSELISVNPYVGKKLMGDLLGNYSYRLNIKDRIIYSIDQKKHCIFIILLRFRFLKFKQYILHSF